MDGNDRILSYESSGENQYLMIGKKKKTVRIKSGKGVSGGGFRTRIRTRKSFGKEWVAIGAAKNSACWLSDLSIKRGEKTTEG